MSLKIFGLLITTNEVLKALESGAISMGEAAVSALLTSDDANAKAVAAAVQAKIDALNAETGKTGLQKLEEAGLDALSILTTYGFTATKDFAIQLVQTIYNKGVAEVEKVGESILVKLGLEKA
jgi:hypothetical protein